MSPSIDVDDEVFDLLKSKAEPFVDTPNTVLRRLLGVDAGGAAGHAGDDTLTAVPRKAGAATSSVNMKAARRVRRTTATKSGQKRTRAASGTLLPEEKYERPLLQALVDAGGQAPYRDVVEAVGRDLKDQLMAADFETLSSGAIRWQSRLQFVRLRLIERGYLDRNAPRGVWGITEGGRAALEGEEAS